MTTDIPGYTYGTEAVPTSPVTLDELEKLKATVLFGDDDVAALRESRAVLADQVDDVLDVWYGFVGNTPHLLAYFSDPEGKPIGDYLDAVRARFGQWILDTAEARYDQAWLDYQHEIALRHHRTKKNQVDGVDAVDHIPMRYVIALLYPITATLEPFLAKKGHGAEDVDRMHQAWIKSVLLQVILWSQPYARDGDF
jgi:hypothetical protein